MPIQECKNTFGLHPENDLCMSVGGDYLQGTKEKKANKPTKNQVLCAEMHSLIVLHGITRLVYKYMKLVT